jgi:hypothetical protein
VVIVEGEKAADAFIGTEMVACATVTGAAGTPEASVLHFLAGKRVILWPDNDEEGRAHMRRVGDALAGIAEEIRWFEWTEGPPKGDAADWRGGSDELIAALDQAPVWEPPQSVDSRHADRQFGENRSTLPIKTVNEVIEEAGEETPWIIENILARGALTEFSGLAKKGGKTTFWCHAIAAGARGEGHAGFRTTPAKYLYLTEQGNNLAEVLRDSGLEEYPEHIRIVRFKDVSTVEWERLIQEAGAEAKRRGFDALVVDTFAVFARLKGSEENEAGPVADRMRVLRLVAQKFDIGVVLIRHAGKDGTPRGSSAFEAEADICVTLSRPEGRHDPTVRRITGIGRYGEWERNIQLQEGRYISLGTDDKVEFNRAVRFIKAVLPDSPEAGMKKQDILDKRTGEDEKITASTLERALKWLVKQGNVGVKQLTDQRGKPKVYWLAYNPQGGVSTNGEGRQTEFGENKPNGSREAVDIYSHQTTFSSHVDDENKSEASLPGEVPLSDGVWVKNLPPIGEDGTYRHGLECACWLCDEDAPEYIPADELAGVA